MTLIKTSFLSFIATAIRVISNIIINKAVAIYVGPSGLAVIGQLQSFILVVSEVAKGGINSGVVKYLAEDERDYNQKSILISTASKISFISTTIVGILLILLSKYLSLEILKDSSYRYLFIMLGLTIILFVLNSLFLSILNGLKEIRLWIFLKISQSVYSLIFTTLLIVFFGLEGALIAIVTNQSIIFLIILFVIWKKNIIKISYFTKRFDNESAKKLFQFSMMALTSAIVIPGSHLLIRNNISGELGWEQAGIWQGMLYISTTYLMVITTALTTYYLPRLSEINDKKELRQELINGYKIIIPIVISLSTIIYFLKDFIITLLFSEAFIGMGELFLWHLVGDNLKIGSWLLAYLMLAKAMTKTYIVTEIFFAVCFVSLSFLFTNLYGLIGTSYSFAASYFLYLIVIFFLTKGRWSSKNI